VLLRKSFILTILLTARKYFQNLLYYSWHEGLYFGFLERRKITLLFLPHTVLFTFPFETGT